MSLSKSFSPLKTSHWKLNENFHSSKNNFCFSSQGCFTLKKEHSVSMRSSEPYKSPHRHDSSYYLGSSDMSNESRQRSFSAPQQELVNPLTECQPWTDDELEILMTYLEMMENAGYQDRFLVILFMRLFPKLMHSRDSVENAIEWIRNLVKENPMFTLRTWRQETLIELHDYLRNQPQPFDIQALATNFHSNHPELNIDSIMGQITHSLNPYSPNVWSPEEEDTIYLFAKFMIQTSPQVTLSNMADVYKKLIRSPKNIPTIMKKLTQMLQDE